MHIFRQITLAMGIAAVLVAPALAQRPGGPGQGRPGQAGGPFGMQGGGLAQIVSMPPVADELKLSEEQIEQTRTIAEQVRADMTSRMQEIGGQLADLSPEERRDRMQTMTREIDESTHEKLKDVLEPEQLNRLQQIQVQQLGLQAFSHPRVLASLNLDDDQKAKLNELNQQFLADSRSVMQNARDAENRAEAMRELVEIRRSAVEEAMGVLTDEQRSSWTELTGEPLQLGPAGFGRGGQPGRVGPGQGGRRQGGNRPTNIDD